MMIYDNRRGGPVTARSARRPAKPIGRSCRRQDKVVECAGLDCIRREAAEEKLSRRRSRPQSPQQRDKTRCLKDLNNGGSYFPQSVNLRRGGRVVECAGLDCLRRKAAEGKLSRRRSKPQSPRQRDKTRGLKDWAKGVIYSLRFANLRRGGRVVECAGLENQSAATYRGFESHPLRHSL